MIELPAALDLESPELETPELETPELETPEPETPERRLPEGYYAENFRRLVETVAERYGDLLGPVEKRFLDAFRGLGSGARRLYVRLVMRKGPLFRRDLVDYAEIPDLDAALGELEAAGLVDGGEEASPEELAALLRRQELIAYLEELGVEAVRGPRPELIAALSSVDPEDALAAFRARYQVIRPLGHEVLWVLRLLFFGNLEQDWREFMLADLGVHRYEPYALGRETRLFDDRGVLLETLALGLERLELRTLLSARGACAEDSLDAALALARRVAASREGWSEPASRHGERILAKVGRALERAQRLEESLELYAVSRRPPSRERRCRVLARLGREREALELCAAIETEPIDAAEAAFAPFFAHRLRRRLGLTEEPWRRERRPIEDLEIDRAALEPPRPAVEWLALALLAEQGRRGVYSENWLWRSLFGLAFWDIVFEPLPGAFAHPFQLGPLDLWSSDFYARRRAAIDARLEELRAEADLEARLLPIYEAKYGTANAFVAWHPQLEESLRFAMRHAGGPALAVVAERLARDPGRHRRGLPDLLVLSEHSPLGVELLEVKAPGDQLRPEQGAWIDALNRRGLPAKVLRLVPR